MVRVDRFNPFEVNRAGMNGPAFRCRSTFGEIRPILLIATDDSRREWPERVYGRTVAEILERRAAGVRLLIGVAEEAYRLARRARG